MLKPLPPLRELDPVVRTARLVLRPFRESDVDDVWPTVSDPAFPRQMTWGAHADRSVTLAFIHEVNEDREKDRGITWAIEHEGHVRGAIGLDDLTSTVGACRVDRAELGYWLVPSLWGRGLMTEAAQAALRYAFETIGLHKVTVSCFEVNEGSRRVIEKCGFRFIGRLAEDLYREGRWWSGLRYEQLASEWATRAAGP